MLAFYLVCLLIGGVLVAVSALGGGHDGDAELDVGSDVELALDLDLDGDFDLDGDLDLDADADIDADADGELDAELGLGAWFPIASMRFWTFFLAFGGLTGFSLTLFDLAGGAIVVAFVAALVGYVCGLGISRLVKHLRTEHVGSTVAENDLLGATASVLLPVQADAPGKVRIELGGRIVDVTAVTEDTEPLSAKRDVLVYRIDEDGTVFVTGRAA